MSGEYHDLVGQLMPDRPVRLTRYSQGRIHRPGCRGRRVDRSLIVARTQALNGHLMKRRPAGRAKEMKR